MPNWMKSKFFNPESERVRLTTHQYAKSTDAQNFRKMNNLQLIDFVELPLKNKLNLTSALKIVCSSKLKDYLNDYYVPLPGDHPVQFCSRNIVNNHLNKQTTSGSAAESSGSALLSTNKETHETNQVPQPSSNPGSNSQCQQENQTNQNIGEENMNVDDDTDEETFSKLVTAFIANIGALHVSLNGREEVVMIFHPFFDAVYEYVFNKTNFPAKPQPWRISTVLEVTYGGWTLIRDTVKAKFKNCKDIQYLVILNLLDNYCPLVLSFYSITLKMNDFPPYLMSMLYM